MLAKTVEDSLASSWLGLDFIIAGGEITPGCARSRWRTVLVGEEANAE